MEFEDREVINALRKALNAEQPYLLLTQLANMNKVSAYEGNDEIDSLSSMITMQLLVHVIVESGVGINVDDIDLNSFFDDLGDLIGTYIDKAIEDKKIQGNNEKDPEMTVITMDKPGGVPIHGNFNDLPEDIKQTIRDIVMNANEEDE